MKEVTLHIKNMICPRCITVLKYEFEKLSIEAEELKLGWAKVILPSSVSMEVIEKMLQKHDFALIRDDDDWLIEQIKLAVRDLLNQPYNPAKVKSKNSVFISKKIGKSYRTLNKVFSMHETITIERYIIVQKIERVKLLIKEEELNLSEIAAELGYSSVQHLSGQFKYITGVSASDYKKMIKS